MDYTTLQNYTKLIAASIGIGVLIAKRHGIDLSPAQSLITDLAVSGLTLWSVYHFPNRPKG